MNIANSFSMTYEQLVGLYPPRPIVSNDQLWSTQRVIDALLDKEHLTPDEENYLTILGMMVEQYEEGLIKAEMMYTVFQAIGNQVYFTTQLTAEAVLTRWGNNETVGSRIKQYIEQGRSEPFSFLDRAIVGEVD